MNLAMFLIICVFGLSLASGLKNENKENTMLPDNELPKLIAEDFEEYLNEVQELPKLRDQVPTKTPMQKIHLKLVDVLTKHREALEATAERNHLSNKELQNHVKQMLLTSPEIDTLERKLAQVVADRKEISPRLFGNIKQWFVSKAVRIVGKMMALPPVPKDADFVDDAYFKG